MLEVSLSAYKNPHAFGSAEYIETERQVSLELLSFPSLPTRAVNALFMRHHNTFFVQEVVVDKENTKKFTAWAKAKGYTIAGNTREPFVFDANWAPVAMYDNGALTSHSEDFSKEIANECGFKVIKSEDTIVIERMTYNPKEGEIDRTPFEIEDDNEVVLDPALYPFIEGGPVKLIDDFIASRSKILLFIGEPGTGKSSLIKYMATKFETTSYGDDPILFSQGVIARTAEELLMTDKRDLIIFEEIDSVIASRKNEANHLIPAILSATSGVVTMGGKLVIVSNIESTKHIDAALMRSSRCYKVVRFEKLSQEQANKAADVLKVPHPTGKPEYSLAEITDGLNPGKAQGIGFF